jgi:hypothetical protein
MRSTSAAATVSRRAFQFLSALRNSRRSSRPPRACHRRTSNTTSTQSCIRRGSDPATGCFWPPHRRVDRAARPRSLPNLRYRFFEPKARLKQIAQRALSSALISQTAPAIAWPIARACFRSPLPLPARIKSSRPAIAQAKREG